MLPTRAAVAFFAQTRAGTCLFEDGSHYEGQWADGQPHGTGRQVTAAGDMYDGQWRAGKRHGLGACRYENGEAYTGGAFTAEREDVCVWPC